MDKNIIEKGNSKPIVETSKQAIENLIFFAEYQRKFKEKDVNFLESYFKPVKQLIC